MIPWRTGFSEGTALLGRAGNAAFLSYALYDETRMLRSPQPPMPVIVGSPRSGTTLLRLMLDSHPELAIPPETGFLPLGARLSGSGDALRDAFFRAVTGYPRRSPNWPDHQVPAEEFRAALEAVDPFCVADGFRTFYTLYAGRFGKRRWGDKTPRYVHHLESIGKVLPEAHFVHLMRDGRDVAVSLRQCSFSPGADIGVQARYWRDNVLAARSQGRRCAHYLELRFEDLVRDPEAALRRVCGSVGLEFHGNVLRHHERASERLREHGDRRGAGGELLVTREERRKTQTHATRPPDPSRVGLWREALSEAERARFEDVAGDLLQQLGYGG
jgi:hypothetical protein